MRGGKEGGVQFIWISKERRGTGVWGVGEDTEDKDKWALMVGLWARAGGPGAGCYGNGCRLLERVHQGVSSRCPSAALQSMSSATETVSCKMAKSQLKVKANLPSVELICWAAESWNRAPLWGPSGTK